ncbi:MAG TPA: hypothetical protein VFA21_21625 [Pyrinomonadaceae bacterium]|jgi:hypothetical protein|nr:hypothetical protein [Pyrinomonadaceae bacterium]
MLSRFQQLLLSKPVVFSVEFVGENVFSRGLPEQSSFQRGGPTKPARLGVAKALGKGETFSAPA